MAKSSAYSFLNVSAILDGVQVTGFWDGDDAVTVEPAVDIGTGLVGADGSSIFSQSTDNSVTITLRVQHTSPTHRQLEQKLARQRAGVLDGFAFSVKDKRSGEGGSTSQAFIQAVPTKSYGKAATVREWVLWAGEWNREVPSNG